MAMFCPTCGKVYEQQASCPNCALPLARSDSRPSSFDLSSASSDWSTTPWIKLVMAVLLAQGLYYALFNVLRAGVLVFGHEVVDLLALQGLQLITVAAGGLLAGAGQRNGMVYGAVVGIWNGAIFLVADFFSGQPFSFVDLYSLPMLHTAFGTLGGLLSGLVRPPPVEYRRATAKPPSSLTIRRSIPKLLMKHVHWGRVVAGVAIAVGGFVYAETLLDLSRQLELRRSYRVWTWKQQALITWEIRVLALIVGGAFSGACTFNGSVQGAWVGLLSCVLLAAWRMGYDPGDLHSLLLNFGLVLAVPFVGGWFGGKLLPPLLPESPRGYRKIPY